jgi:type IV secretory pathway TrbD component
MAAAQGAGSALAQGAVATGVGVGLFLLGLAALVAGAQTSPRIVQYE